MTSQQMPNFAEMSIEDIVAWKQAQTIPSAAGTPGTGERSPEGPRPLASPQAEQRMSEAIFGPAMTEPGCTHPDCILAHPHAGPAQLPPVPQDPYSATAQIWGQEGYDFVTPGGRRCMLRSLPIEKLAAKGILDRITRLPGLTDALIRRSEGQPPTKDSDDVGTEQIASLVEVLNVVLPEVIVKPQVYSAPNEGDERVVGRIYVDSIPLSDRIAILTEAVGGVAEFDSFRK